MVDALFWLKPPGQSDGCVKAQPTCSAYGADPMCGSPDSIGSSTGEPLAPPAGFWWQYDLISLAQHAHLTSSAASATRNPGAAVAFGACAGEESACAAGYECEMRTEGGVCMPTAATIKASSSNAAFATRLAHATA